MIPSPRSQGVPHSEWRPNQYESLCWLRQNLYNGNKFSILESPCGCGKSGTVTGLAQDEKIMVLVSSLSLGQQYQDNYGYCFLPGRHRHKCVNADYIQQWLSFFTEPPTAGNCPYPKMKDCTDHDRCPYILAREQAKRSRKVVLTYKYAAIAEWPKERGGVLVCDEAHDLPEEILQSAETEITHWMIKRYSLPQLDSIFPSSVHHILTPSLRTLVFRYLGQCWKETLQYRKHPQSLIGGAQFHFELDRLFATLSQSKWFVDVGSVIQNFKSLVIRPLDASAITHRLWANKKMTVLMSATIGNPAPLAREIGIDKFLYRSVPHIIPPDKRPVYTVFRPKMSKYELSRKEWLYRGQAYAISHWINREIPNDWRGIILTTSYDKITRLRKHLDIGDRLWHPPKTLDNHWVPVPTRVRAFLCDKRSGIVAVDTLAGWGQGLDLRGDLGRFVVVAGVQHANPTDPYYAARMEQEGGRDYLRWLAYNGVMQASGRVSRGERIDDDEYLENVAAIADGCALTKPAMQSYSGWFKEAMR